MTELCTYFDSIILLLLGIAETVGIFLATFPVNDFTGYVLPTLNDSAASKFLTGIGLQYAGVGMIEEINAMAPQLKTWETETPCGNGQNDWKYGEAQFDSMINFLSAGATVYSQWNMVLDSSGKSGWGWSQSAPVTVDIVKKKATLNPSYYATKHFSFFITPGAKRVGVTSSQQTKSTAMAFKLSTSDEIVVVLSNPEDDSVVVQINVDGSIVLTESLPPRSFSSFIIVR